MKELKRKTLFRALHEEHSRTEIEVMGKGYGVIESKLCFFLQLGEDNL